MDYKEFSSKIKAKYPGAYDDLDDMDLAKKMIQKYPQYADISFPKGPQPTQAPHPAALGPGIMDSAKKGATAFLRTPALPIAAGTVTGMATAGASPLVSAPAAALAGGAGEAARQMGLRALTQKNFLDQGNPEVPQTSGEAAGLIGRRALEQGAAELGGRALGMVAKPILAAVGKGAAAGMKGLTKIPAEHFARIFKNPAELITAPTKSAISKAYGKVGFFAKETLEESLKGATASDSALIKTGFKEMEKPFVKVKIEKLVDARKAIDSMVDQAKFFGGPKQARSAVSARGVRLSKLRTAINAKLDSLAELGRKDAIALRIADKMAAKGASANAFRSLVPRVNVMQSTPRLLTAPFTIPLVAGGATALAGAAGKIAPAAGRAALGAGASGLDMGGALVNALQRRKKGR